MPSFTFVGDEPLSLPCSVTINDKAKQAFSKANDARGSSDTQTVASLVTAIPRQVQFRLHSHKPGSLGFRIKCGDQYCTVTAKANPTSPVKVDDIIISCNGCRYDSMIKLEDGKTSWMNYLRTPGVKSFIVLRQGGKVGPLKEIGNTKMSQSGKARSAGSSYNELSLAQESLYWKTGKGSRQTSQCKATISACLLHGMSTSDIASYVVRSMKKDDQPYERVRVREYACRLRKSLKIEATGQAVPAATTTRPTDVEDLLSLGIPFQQNGVIYTKGDKTKKRKLLREASANIDEKLDSNDKGRINVETTQGVGTQVETDQDQAKLRTVNRGDSGKNDSLERAFDTAIITPSNSMEEVDTTRSDD